MHAAHGLSLLDSGWMVAFFATVCGWLVFVPDRFVLSFASIFLVILLFFSLLQTRSWFIEQGV
ncbi:hypothetical protein BGI33_06365 [Snodgrassella alvi]|nr:hypothetical protein BGI33_06365 [Snodgrassella alvi]